MDDRTRAAWNGRLKTERLGAKTKARQQDLSDIARHEAAERRKMCELRSRPSYTNLEAQQPFEAEARLIKADEITTTAEPEAAKPRPTFAEMREQRNAFPPVSREVIERKLAQKRGRERSRKK